MSSPEPVPGAFPAPQNESIIQPPTEVVVKRVLAGVVAFATAGVATFPEHTVAYRVCFVVVGLGAALGITSRGVLPK